MTITTSSLTEAKTFIHALDSTANRLILSHNGVNVCWRGFGKGRPLVLIHGGHGSWLHWVRNIETLAQDHSVWVPDLPGFGDSDTPSDPTSFDMLLDILQGTLDQIVATGTTVDMVGFSWGGVVAAHMASRYQAVSRLGLLGPTGHGGQRRERAPLVNWRRSENPEQMIADLQQNLEVLMLSTPADALALEVHCHSCLKTRFRSKGTSQTPKLLANALDNFDGPVQMLWGASDVTGIPDVIGPLLVGGNAKRHWSSIPDRGHWIQYEAADQVNTAIERWMTI